MNTKPLPCPFCGSEPVICPTRPEEEGATWADVRCMNEKCYARPIAGDYPKDDPGRGPVTRDFVVARAIERWNTRTPTEKT